MNNYMLNEIQPTVPARRLATQQVGYDRKGKNSLCSGANCSNTHNIISSMAPHKFNVVLRTTTDEFNVLPRTEYKYKYRVYNFHTLEESTTFTQHYITLHYITLHYITLHYITLHHITSHYITLHHITSHHIPSHHITSHHITSHHITLHHITSH